MPEADSTPAMPKSLPMGQASRRPSTVRTIIALVMREMSTTHGRSALGYLWAILEPAAGILLLTLVFSFAFRAPAIGTNFPLFFASGILPFMTFMKVSQTVAAATRFSRPLLAYPGVTFMDALLARLIVNGMTQILIFIIVITAILFFHDVDVILDPLAIVLGLVMALSLGAGIGTLNCYLLTSYPVWERIWAITTRPLFFVSGIFYTFQSVSLPFRDYLWWNPLVHVIGQIRSGIYTTYDGTYVSVIYVMLVSYIPMMAGLVLLRRYHRDMLNM
jgi:capsular polysaccharide transport system permease protein